LFSNIDGGPANIGACRTEIVGNLAKRIVKFSKMETGMANIEDKRPYLGSVF
jgi:hypothetical protein